MSWDVEVEDKCRKRGTEVRARKKGRTETEGKRRKQGG